MKKIIFLFGVVIFAAINFVTVYNSISDGNNTVNLLFEFTKATATEEYNPGDKLLQVGCECPNGKKGETLRCKSNGDKEHCTPTQQGSNACYGANLFNAQELLCEGSGIKFD